MRLDGIRVLDLSRLLPGPYGTQLLADMGAEVVNVERPPGDADDGIPDFDAVQRGKKRVTLDLKTEAGREAFLRLSEEADVVLEQFRPGVVDRLGVGYDDVVERNPDLIYCSLSGYGQTGPYADRVGHDLNYVGFAGLLDMTRSTGDAPPAIPGYPIADMAGGVFSALSIVGALLTRELGNGSGQYIDVSMQEAVAALSQAVAPVALAGGDPRAGETMLTGEQPCYNVYETADGQYVTLAALEPKFWAAFCQEIDREDLIEKHMADDEAVREAVRAELAETFARKTQAEWEEQLGDEDVMFGVVRTPSEMLDDPQIEARGTVIENEEEGMMPRIGFPAQTSTGFEGASESVAETGEHTDALLAECGYTDDEIETLREDRAI